LGQWEHAIKSFVSIAAVLCAGAIAGLVAVFLIDGLPTWMHSGLSEREEREACETALKARIGSFTLTTSPTSMRSVWPHSVTLFIGAGTTDIAVCRFAREGSMTIDLK
jgi:hypothetical protein